MTRLAIDPAEVAERGHQAGEALGGDPAGFVDALVERVLPRVERDDDPLIETIGGGMRLSAYLPARTFELVVHGFDIAAAAGLEPPTYSRPVLVEAASIAAGAAVATGRGPTVIAALTGRAGLPPGFSVV